MCGIFGFTFPDKALGSQMAKTLKHRGPDHSSVYVDEDMTLGYTRLSIIDLAGGNQPIYSEDGTILVFFNGEIYNYAELKEQLEKKGHRFATESDTEVLVHGYEEWGKLVLSKLNGMFAFALYDIKKKELFLARDRLGEKPLYYIHTKKMFAFASEMKALLPFIEKKEIDEASLAWFLTMRYSSREETMIKGIKKLLPGHSMSFKNGKLNIQGYWDFPAEKEMDFLSCVKRFSGLIEDSVKRRMVADVKVGSLLSGGIDSSTIVAYMSRHSDKVRTFTLGFDGGSENEFSHAKLVSETFGTEHHEYTIGPESLKLLPKITYYLDEPLADPTAIPNYVLAKNVSRHATVLMNGDGADELLGGYEQYSMMGFLSGPIKHPMKLSSHILSSMFPDDPFFLKLRSFSDSKNSSEKYQELVSVFGRDELHAATKIKADTPNLEFEDKKDMTRSMLLHDSKTYLPDNMLTKFDRLTMANSIEGRVPFCDHRIAELAFQMPSKFKVDGNRSKIILRASSKGLLPESIVNRKKQRFLVPTDNWMERGLSEYAESVIDEEKDVVARYFDKDYIGKLMKNKFASSLFLSRNKLMSLYYSRQLWTVNSFLLWHKEFIEH
ncbi:MAG: asparagine synthase (glutamine-hydrolyzing) [Nanoarchaeota archaeon]|nr:asparagine synthase (glutamine-hydrolyzing) [Nanoarchaeota archaeon]